MGEERRGEEGKEVLEVAVPRPTYSLLNCNIEDTAYMKFWLGTASCKTCEFCSTWRARTALVK